MRESTIFVIRVLRTTPQLLVNVTGRELKCCSCAFNFQVGEEMEPTNGILRPRENWSLSRQIHCNSGSKSRLGRSHIVSVYLHLDEVTETAFNQRTFSITV